MPQRLQSAAKVEVQKPFMQEQELKDKTARLAVLDKELNMSAMRSAPPREMDMVSKRVHETGSIYGEDIEDLRKSYDWLWGAAEEIILRLAAI